MSPAEIGHRVTEQLSMLRLRFMWRARRSPGGKLPAVSEVSFLVEPNAQLAMPVCRAGAVDDEALLEGIWSALGFSWQWNDSPDVWRRAPDTGRCWPTEFFGAISYRAGNPFGDIRVSWEPARLQQLVALGLLMQRADGDRRRRAVDLFENQLMSFTRENPSLVGIHYVSAMECALRIIAVCHGFDLARSQLPQSNPSRAAVLRLVAEHAALIERRLSLHSSAGNHTIAECAGLAYAGFLFPELAGSRRWIDIALPLLEAELQRQILEDGGGLEQAFWYLLFITELAELVIDLASRCGGTISDATVAAARRAGSFLREMSCNSGADILPVGDRDDGCALVPGLQLVLGATPEPAEALRSFPQSGYSVLRGGPSRDWRVVMDHGPLGMPPSCGHGHADALSVILTDGDQDVLIDPGTYTYTGDPDLRAYFRSAFAHNTLTVDGRDQADQETAFMWSSHYQAEVLNAAQRATGALVMARHDGYRRLGVVHYRGVMLAERGLVVWDYLAGTGPHYVELRWQCAAAGEVNGAAVNLETGHSIEISGVVDLSLTAGKGISPPALRAPRYGEVQGIWEVKGSWEGQLPHTMMTVISHGNQRIQSSLVQASQQTFLEWISDARSA